MISLTLRKKTIDRNKRLENILLDLEVISEHPGDLMAPLSISHEIDEIAYEDFYLSNLLGEYLAIQDYDKLQEIIYKELEI